MPRIRTIKPDAFKSDSLSLVPRGTRWTFAGLWTYADDEGRARDDARLIKAELYPLDDDMTRDEVEADLRRLAEIDGICRYEVGGKRYLHMPNWDHQKINRPTPSRLPECPKEHDSVSPHGVSTEDSGNLAENGQTRRSDSVSPGSLSTHGGLSEDSPPERKGKEGEQGKGNEVSATAIAVPDAPRDDVEEICEHLAGAIEANGSKRPTITTKWRQAARLMLDKDGRTEQEVHGAIDWSQRDEFWRSNILSLPTLREKYDTLRLQAQRKSGSTSRSEEWRSMQERQMARALERERQMGLH